MTRILLLIAWTTILLGSTALATSITNRILVVQETPTEEYSIFWKSLSDRGYELTHRSITSLTPALTEHEESSFDHLILFAPKAKSLPSDLTPQRLFNFVEQAHNILLVLSPQLTEFWRDFSREFEVELDDRDTRVVDHFNFDSLLDDGSHTTLVIPVDNAPSPIISASTKAGPPVLFKGVAHAVGRIPLLFPVLSASNTAYSMEDRISNPAEDMFVSGSSTGLVSSFQARNNARVTFVGSMELFSNEFALSPVSMPSGEIFDKSGNVAFLHDLTSWTFQETGVLLVGKQSHVRVSDGESHPLYRVGEDLLCQMEISEKHHNTWLPYSANDIQLEFTMLNPHLRIPFSPTATKANSTVFASQFRAPDAHGVFTIKIDHRRAGWTWLEEKMVVSITPPRHNQFDRFITGALPYYSGAFSVSGAVILFVIIWTLQ